MIYWCSLKCGSSSIWVLSFETVKTKKSIKLWPNPKYTTIFLPFLTKHTSYTKRNVTFSIPNLNLTFRHLKTLEMVLKTVKNAWKPLKIHLVSQKNFKLLKLTNPQFLTETPLSKMRKDVVTLCQLPNKKGSLSLKFHEEDKI